MKNFRTLALAISLGCGLAGAPVAFAQTQTGPADPNSPGAVVIPDKTKDYRDRSGTKQKSDQQDMRDRGEREGAAGPAGTRDSTRDDPGKESPAAPRPQRSDG
jgi:hypothetical protein